MLTKFFNSTIIHSNLIFWIGWVILPILLEFIPAVCNFWLLLRKKVILNKQPKELKFFPQISLLIPIYNSSATLYACLKSINDSTYPNDYIDVLCIDNGSKDNSFQIFQQAQLDFVDLPMNWLHSANGKSNALNMAIFNSTGKYIINIDSDGQLEETALYNLIKKFELNKDIDCMTGAILIEPTLIEQTPKDQKFLKVFRKIEFMEYCQAFLAGRNFQAETNTIFTLSGAFSAFRKSTLLKTRMYNTETVGEDTHLTFQVKENLHQKVSFCEDAIFMVDPIENLDKYYTQRQRWQLGELEVANMFFLNKMKKPYKILFDYTTRLIIKDHTMSFPKFIWLFVMILLCFVNHNYKIVLCTLMILYLLDFLQSYLFSLNILQFLHKYPKLRRYYAKHIFCIFLLPFYTWFSYLVRFCGIINAMTRKASWKTKTFTEEKQIFKDSIKSDFNWLNKVKHGVRHVFEIDYCGSER